MKKYKFKINNVPIEINSYLDASHLEKNELIDFVLKQTKPNRDIGYGGFKEKKYFEKFLKTRIRHDEEMKNKPLNISDKEHVDQVKDALKKCSSVLENKLYIFTFPIFSKFVSEKMNGCGGFTPYKNVFYIEISPHENKEKQKESIKHTVVHELGHALSGEHRTRGDVSRMLKEEGLNEHFRESMVGGGRDSWTKAISKQKAMEIFNEINKKGKLDEKDSNFYHELFFGKNKKYPLWAGYTIGYYLMKDYLNSLEGEIDWKKLFKTSSKEIMNSIIKSQNKKKKDEIAL